MFVAKYVVFCCVRCVVIVVVVVLLVVVHLALLLVQAGFMISKHGVEFVLGYAK